MRRSRGGLESAVAVDSKRINVVALEHILQGVVSARNDRCGEHVCGDDVGCDNCRLHDGVVARHCSPDVVAALRATGGRHSRACVRRADRAEETPAVERVSDSDRPGRVMARCSAPLGVAAGRKPPVRIGCTQETAGIPDCKRFHHAVEVDETVGAVRRERTGGRRSPLERERVGAPERRRCIREPEGAVGDEAELGVRSIQAEAPVVLGEHALDGREQRRAATPTSSSSSSSSDTVVPIVSKTCRTIRGPPDRARTGGR